MQELRSLETSALIDLLAVQTANYTRMLNEGSTEEEFARCCLMIKVIQSEIESRKRTKDNTSATNHNTVSPVMPSLQNR